jgi:hypothetical protein
MSDLLLQGLRDLPGEMLVKILSDEKKRMFGAPEFLVKRKGRESVLCSRVLVGSLANLGKEPLIPDKEGRGGRDVRT